MCDYSLESISSRPATVGDRLVTHQFSPGSRGFASPCNLNTAVCLLPGTELAFSGNVAFRSLLGWRRTVGYRTAIFRKINLHEARTHHDALEFPNGRIVLLLNVCTGQEGTVLQLPAQERPEAPLREAQNRVEPVV